MNQDNQCQINWCQIAEHATVEHVHCKKSFENYCSNQNVSCMGSCFYFSCESFMEIEKVI